MITAQLLFKIAACLYAAALIVDIASGVRRGPVAVLLLAALVANAASLLLRYLPAWPMMPMYMGAVALPLVLGIFRLAIPGRIGAGRRVRRTLLGFSVLISLLAVFFPKDFYLPFLKSQGPWAHLFLLLATVGKACFLTAAAWALAALMPQKLSSEYPSSRHPGIPASRHPSIQSSAFPWTVWGFSLWTLSMFAGELWSYRGWGTPVAWEDPAITTIMATWFFYIGLLHLHLTGTWSPKRRNICTAAGALVIVLFNVLPDLGPFRGPF